MRYTPDFWKQLPQLPFNVTEGHHLKQAGLDQVESDAEFLRVMRWYARILSRTNGSVSTDDLRTVAAQIHLEPRSSHSWGAIFKGKGWTVIGRKPSTLASNHHRWINVYRGTLDATAQKD